MPGISTVNFSLKSYPFIILFNPQNNLEGKYYLFLFYRQNTEAGRGQGTHLGSHSQ